MNINNDIMWNKLFFSRKYYTLLFDPSRRSQFLVEICQGAFSIIFTGKGNSHAMKCKKWTLQSTSYRSLPTPPHAEDYNMPPLGVLTSWSFGVGLSYSIHRGRWILPRSPIPITLNNVNVVLTPRPPRLTLTSIMNVAELTSSSLCEKRSIFSESISANKDGSATMPSSRQ